jgi:deoxyhypusine synthase
MRTTPRAPTAADCSGAPVARPPTIGQPSAVCPDDPALIEQIAERVERLLVRHEELQRTNELLAQQVQALTHERDNLARA